VINLTAFERQECGMKATRFFVAAVITALAFIFFACSLDGSGLYSICESKLTIL
jgi:hypothetical protein